MVEKADLSSGSYLKQFMGAGWVIINDIEFKCGSGH